ncbi:MAG: RNA-binding S4 domain-containing protein [Verrucomicrobiota bacterium]|nr:RNA-binding S4 domain-containing protein [Verrucomicrobiota bacterium]
MVNSPEPRIDKFLWAVRIYKTRSLASDACRKGQILLGKVPAKPSRIIKLDDLIEVHLPDLVRTIRVIQLLEKRVGPKLVDQYIQDLTPAEEYLKALEAKRQQRTPAAAQRPSKKDRRILSRIKESL